MKRILLSIVGLAAFSATQAQVNINIDAQNRGPKISPTHYGIFFEDINHAADGGLYAELIRNRSFEDGPRYGAPADMQGWTVTAPVPAGSPSGLAAPVPTGSPTGLTAPVPAGSPAGLAAPVPTGSPTGLTAPVPAGSPAGITARLIQPTKKSPLLNAAQHNALQLTLDATPDAPACLINEGFWGINTVQGRTYRLSLWLKGKYKGTIKARLQAAPTAPKGTSVDLPEVYAETIVSPSGDEKGAWRKYTATLCADGNDPKAQFALVFDGKGTLDLDVISLFPPTFKNRPNGMRPDLANMLWQMHPKFMRFPGGCFVEGQESPDNAFRWERTIGPIEEREGHWNVNWGYRTTDGIGFHEYLQLAEDLGAKPLYVVNVGLWHGGLTPVEELQPWIDECLNALEYANGDVTTKYGALRAKNGHPAPFNIEYLEIGNENNQPNPREQSDRYYERYDKFHKAIREKYPDIKLIGNVVAWGDDNPKWNSPLPVDLLDEHYYRTPGWFAEAFHKYDSYDRRGPKIYVGEYAVTNGFGDLGNMNAALGEAVYMMGMENNSDIVPLNSYAPIFVNENDAKWRPDMIRFNSHTVMGTPSYYVQQLMPQHVGTQVVRLEQENPYTARAKRQLTPKRSRVGFGTWGTNASFETSDEVDYIYGDWQREGNTVSQRSRKEATICLQKTVVDSDHYTVKFRARKDRGAEGFLIIFNYVDAHNYCWLNFGGWGNTTHAIEQINSGGKIQNGMTQGRIETGRWYDITLNVEGDKVKAWLDDKLVFDTELRHDTTKGIYSSATIDEPSGELIVKVVNTGDERTTAALNLTNFTARSASLVRLAANDGMDENTLLQPTNIHPTEQVLTPESDNRLLVEIPAYSLNIIRVRP